TISNKVGVTVSPVLAPAVAITASPASPVPPGQPVTFTAAPTNGGSAPDYLWYLNDVPIAGNNGSTWTTSSLRDGDFVKVRMESKVACPNPPLVFSSSAIMRVARTGIEGVGATGSGPLVYPTIVTELLHIDFSMQPVSAEIIITNSYGSIVERARLHRKEQAIRVAQWPNAVYFYRIITPGAEYSGKLVK